MKKLLIILSICSSMAIFIGCNSTPTKDDFSSKEETTETPAATTENGNPSYDPNRGEGKFTKVDIGATLDAAMATSGEKVYGVKCSSCHKTTDEKLVGPGWKGVTTRRTPEWIMNFITNTDEMINKDPAAQAQLEICLVRMPNQSLSDDDARHLLEFMRKNDGVK
ncbi:MAG: cytochrome c [Sphingobacteriales bacterium]|jgi:mono/diheme cytochrome c family protein|nr:cytochrome c [Sphingobacteriales bacterium]